MVLRRRQTKRIKELVSICIALRDSREYRCSQVNGGQSRSIEQESCGFVAICEGPVFMQLVLDLELLGHRMTCLMALVSQFPSR